MKLSNQALGAVMLALQNSLMEQTDIVPVLRGFEFRPDKDELIVTNPPIVHADAFESEDTKEPEGSDESGVILSSGSD